MTPLVGVMPILLLVGGCASPADDLDAICDEARKLQAGQAPYAELDPSVRVTVFARAVESRLKTKPMKSAWAAIASASPEMRYPLLQKAGQEAGVDDWQCPPLDLWSNADD